MRTNFTVRLSIATLAILLMQPFTILGQWTRTSGPEGGIIHTLVADGNDLFAGTSYGVYRSRDNGVRWEALSTDMTDPRIQSLVVLDGILFAGTQGGGVCRSANGGQSWSAVNSGLTSPYVQALAASGDLIIVGTQSGGGQPGLSG